MENVSLTQEQDKDDIIIKCSLEKMAKAFFKDYEIIWHDPNVNSEENQQNLMRLEKICKVKKFTEWKEAGDYIKAAKTICHVITSGTNGEVFVEEIFASANVPNIFAFCRDKEYHSTWTQDYKKVLCTETKIEDILSQIQKSLQEWQKQTSSLKFDLPAFAPVFNDWDKSQMNHLHLYLKVIPQFKNWKQAKQDILNLSKKVYSDKKIADFEQTYNEYNKEAILRWYTQQSFLFKIVNNCLRIATSDSIQWSRLLLKDIERAIKDQYSTKSKSFSGVLYRAACLSDKEWLSLKENVNREIEMHGFLSTSKVKEIALNFMEGDSTQNVFITIIVLKSPIEDEQGFAEVDKFSEYPQEREVLFNVRSRFLILEAEDESPQNLPYRHLVLLYGAQGLRKYITEENPMQQVSLQDVGSMICSRCQAIASDIPEKLFFLSLTDPEKPIYSCQKCLGDDVIGPFLCIPLTEKASTVNVKGCLTMNSSQTQIPLYGYKCSQCGVKNKKRYFVCTDCHEKWCENCFENSLSCISLRHPIILENYPFSFWCERMSENELNHLKFQNNFMTDSNDEFHQAKMYYDTHEYEKAAEYCNVFIEKNEAKGKKSKLAHSYSNLGLIYTKLEEYKKALEYYFKSLEINRAVYGENHSSAAISSNNIGMVYHEQGEYDKALQHYFKSLEINISIYGENNSYTATSYDNIGSVYANQGEYNKALDYYSKSLNIKESIHGKNHPEVAHAFHNIGSIYERQGEYSKSLEYHLISLDIRKLVYGERHPDVATSVNSVGSVYLNQGEFQKAFEYYLKSLEINKSIYGENHSSVAISYNNIGSIYQRQGEYKMALEYLLKSLNIRKLVHGESHPDVANSENNIGFFYYQQGEYNKALKHYFNSLEINKSIFGENHPDVAISYNNIGLVYRDQGESQKALEYLEKSLVLCTSIFGENHPGVATASNNVGLVYHQQGEFYKALEYYSKSLDIRKSVYGETHPDVANSYSNLGTVNDDLGELEKALEYHQKALTLSQSIHGKSHLAVATSFLNIGSISHKQGRFKEALECYFKSLNMRKSAFGENHPDVGNCYNDIGLVYMDQEEYKEALEYHFRALKIRKSVLGESHSDVAVSFFNIASIYHKQEKWKEALEYYFKAFNIRKSVLGENHPHMVTYHNNIGSIYFKQGKSEEAIKYYVKALDIYKSVYGEDHLETAIFRDKILKMTSIIAQKAKHKSFSRAFYKIYIFNVLLLIILFCIDRRNYGTKMHLI